MSISLCKWTNRKTGSYFQPTLPRADAAAAAATIRSHSLCQLLSLRQLWMPVSFQRSLTNRTVQRS